MSVPYAVPVLMPARDRARVREQLAPPMPNDGLWGWVGPLLVTLFAGVLRFWDLSRPKAFMFDETYYAKDAWSLLHFGVEQDYIKAAEKGDPDPANVKILAGNLDDLWTGDASYVVHPPGGKWVIALGEQMFGMTPFGWRFMVALTGTLAVLIVARTGRRLFRSTLLGCTAGLLLTLDGMAFVHSRTALLDPLVMFWALVAFAALVLDRDRARERLADQLAAAQTGRVRPGSRAAPVAAGRRPGARHGVRHQVERAVVRRRLRPDDGALGHGCTPRRRRPPAVDRRAGARRRSGLRLDRAGRVRRLPGQLDRLVPRWRRRLLPLLGAGQPGAAAGAGRAVEPLALPPRGVEIPHRAGDLPPLPVQPVGLAGARPAGVLLLRGPDDGPGRLHRRPVLAGGHRPRHAGDLVGVVPRAAGAALPVGRAA